MPTGCVNTSERGAVASGATAEAGLAPPDVAGATVVLELSGAPARALTCSVKFLSGVASPGFFLCDQNIATKEEWRHDLDSLGTFNWQQWAGNQEGTNSYYGSDMQM